MQFSKLASFTFRCLPAFVALFPFCQLAASSMAVSRQQLVAAADAVLLGQVLSMQSTADERRNINTFIKLEVERDFSGQVAPKSTVYLKQPGGRFHGIGEWASENPEFEVGERVVVFVELQPDGFFRVAHMSQGKFNVSASGRLGPARPGGTPGSRSKTRPFETLEEIAKATAKRKSRPLGRFTTQLSLPDAENLTRFSSEGFSAGSEKGSRD